MPTKINARPNGPLIIEGEGLEVYDPTGAKVEMGETNRLVLCRCGASKTKPFCDSTHRTNGFQASEAAVAPAKK
jgi:CDGSH-type Zn-finger protein